MAGLIDFAIGTGGNAGTRFRATGSRIYGEEYHWSIRLLVLSMNSFFPSFVELNHWDRGYW